MLHPVLFALLACPLPQEAPAPPKKLQVSAAEMILPDGSRVEDGVLVVENGRITRVGRGVELDPAVPTIEHDGVLTAGLVACGTRSGRSDDMFDETRAMLPAARVALAFAPEHSDFERALAAGITSVLLVPSAQSVVGGRTAVVKTAGGTVVQPEAHLAISFGKDALGAWGFQMPFFFGAGAAREGGPEFTDRGTRGTREPTSYPGVVRALDEAFASGVAPYDRAASGALPVLAAAFDRNEVDRALRFFGSHGLRGAIHGASRAGELAGRFSEAGVGVVLGPFGNGQTWPSLESFAALAAAGVPLAFALDAPEHSPERFRLSAAMAVTAGAEPASVLRALTSDAARIANASERIGSLEKGHDADFVLWSGDPLDLTTRVVAVYVDGERVHGDL